MAESCLLGVDIGSSAVKACLLDASSRRRLGKVQSPVTEMPIDAPAPGRAEQDPELWWRHLAHAVRDLLAATSVAPTRIAALGITYQMHGLVLVDDRGSLLRPAIIWCDGRAVEAGRTLERRAGSERCNRRLLNAPGNFTAAKLAWVAEHEPELYERACHLLLPGDWIAFRMTGRAATTAPGLSEGTLWDFRDDRPANFLLEASGLDPALLPDLVPTCGRQGVLTAEAAAALGLAPGTPVTYRAGDQPNNAFALGVLEEGQVAATAGTSGVVYGVTRKASRDPRQRVNTFAHVNHSGGSPRFGTLLCVNGAGALYSWLRRETAEPGGGYERMDAAAAGVAPGSEGLVVLPFGNGVERMLDNRHLGAWIGELDFARHRRSHLWRAAQEGIACALAHCMEVLGELGLEPRVIRAAHANLFLSPIFREAFAALTDTAIELHDTDGAQGAALAAGVGVGLYPSLAAAISDIRPRQTVVANARSRVEYRVVYDRWREALARALTHRSGSPEPTP